MRVREGEEDRKEREESLEETERLRREGVEKTKDPHFPRIHVNTHVRS